MAADLYFSDRLLGPLISFTAERLEQKQSPLLIQVIVAASLAAAVVLVLTSLSCVDGINVQAVFSRSAVESGWESGGG